MTAGVHVWDAAPSDRDALVTLEAEIFGRRSWGAKSIREGLEEGRGAAFLAGAERQAPVGFAMWRSLGEDAELLAIGVVQTERGQGLGAMLLDAVKQAARRAGAMRVLLEVDADNDAALALYRAAGFQQVGVRQAYYRDGADALVMNMLL